MKKLFQLNRLQRITLILLGIVVVNLAMSAATGYSLLGGDLFVLFFIGFLIVFVIACIRPLLRKILWRVRHRLLVTYFLVGVLPIFLIVFFVFLGFYLVLGQTAGYLLRVELDRRLAEIYSSAERSAQSAAAGRERPAPADGEEVIIRMRNQRSKEFPNWSMPGFKGIIRDGDTQFIAAHAEAGSGERRVEAFAFQRMDNKWLAQLLPGVASVEVIGGENIRITIGPRGGNPKIRLLMDSSDVMPGPAQRSWWDLDLGTALPLEIHLREDGKTEPEVMAISSRPSAVLGLLFSTLGSIARVISFAMLVIALVFLFVEVIALIFSVQLTRTLTRSVHDLYAGTKKVEAGDFSHRIPIRKKDQLGELAVSFNSMTGRIEQLIVEVKEKEKLESELEIARQVQSQLFPREVPKLKTLELTGLCNPARVVSGDYYDFIPIDSRSMALIIGDISGKGISAALLMASVQSSLHAQLTAGANGSVSPAVLVSRLNRQLYENTPPEKYATFYCGVYDEQNGRLSYTNAGHLAPLLVRRNNVIRLESNGMAVGLFPDFPYEQSAIELQPGDLLMAFTDGITESENAAGDQFGETRLTELLIRSSEKPLDEIVQVITSAIKDWAYDLDNQDDTTILLARRL